MVLSSLILAHYFFEDTMAFYYLTNHLESPSASFQSVKEKPVLHTQKNIYYIEDVFLG